MSCECEVCRYINKVRAKIEKLPDEHQDFFENMLDAHLELQYEHDYYRALIRGDWPNADDVIKSKRDMLKKKQNEVS